MNFYIVIYIFFEKNASFFNFSLARNSPVVYNTEYIAGICVFLKEVT